jgi:cysteinyl-tRNA synthetase
VPFEELAARSGSAVPTVASPAAVDEPAPAGSLRATADGARALFDAALGRRDADAAGAAVLQLEQALADWSADTLDSADADHARRTLRGMVLELAAAARDGLADPADRVAPLVESLLRLRRSARERKDFATSDALRDELLAAGVEVRDGPDGVEWSLQTTTGAGVSHPRHS